MKRTRVILAGVATVAALALTACGGGGTTTRSSSGGSSAAPSDTIVVGSANFPESALLAQIYAGALDRQGRQGHAPSSTSAAGRPTSPACRTARST